MKAYFLQHGACFWDFFLHIFFHLLFFLFHFFLLFFHFFIHGFVCLFFSEITDCGCDGSCWRRSGHFFLNQTRCEVLCYQYFYHQHTTNTYFIFETIPCTFSISQILVQWLKRVSAWGKNRKYSRLFKPLKQYYLKEFILLVHSNWDLLSVVLQLLITTCYPCFTLIQNLGYIDAAVSPLVTNQYNRHQHPKTTIFCRTCIDEMS